MAPKLDLLLSPFDADPRQLQSTAAHAEQVGFDGIWTYDHMTGAMFDRGHSLDAFTLLGAFAVSTERVQLGPLVANLMNRHPVRLALAANTLQQLSGGRAILGLGSGAAPGSRFAREHEALGTQLADGTTRREMLIEAIAALRALWQGATSLDGQYFPIDDFNFAVGNDNPPPVIVGASGPATARLAFSHGDGINIANPKALAGLRDLVISDRPDNFEVSVHVTVSPDDAVPFDQQLPEPESCVDRWVFAVPTQPPPGWIEEFSSAVRSRFC